MLMSASFFFYSYWFPPYLLLLLTSGCIDYFVSKKVVQAENKRQKKLLLVLSIFTNLSILGFFKYTNFLLQIAGGFHSFLTGIPADYQLLHLILPIGISFYTFQSLSYTIDVYRGKLKPCDQYLDFFLYLSFFPQLVAGPIVRAIDFLPQLETKSKVGWQDYQFSLYRICRGYFLKVFIADQIARHANNVFAQAAGDLNTPLAWLGAICFSIQIFCDFAGYSDIAIGTARLFGFKIKENFKNPYFARGIEDFWRRWHISLSSWFRDYVYIPLGGNRSSNLRTELNILMVFIISGFWHGANWTFLFWGACHGSAVFLEKRIRENSIIKIFRSSFFSGALIRSITLVLIVFLWVPFRAPGLEYTFVMWEQMVTFQGMGSTVPISAVNLIWVFICFTLVQCMKEVFTMLSHPTIRTIEICFYFVGILTAPWSHTDFIYFQF